MFSNRKKRFARTGGIVVASVAAVALALTSVGGTGAYFTASGEGSANMQSGTLNLALGTPGDSNHSTFALNYVNLAPGEHIDHKFTVKNTGSVDATVHIKSTNSGGSNTAALDGSDWQEFKKGIVGYTQMVPSTAALNADAGVIHPGQTRTFTLRESLDSTAGNEWQGVGVGVRVFVTLEQAH